MKRSALLLLTAALLAACGSENVTGGVTPRLDRTASPVFVVSGIAVAGDEGASLTLEAATTLSVANGPVSIEWAFGDSSPVETTTSATSAVVTTHTWDDNADTPYVAYATVTNADGEYEQLRFDVTVHNVAPSATLVVQTTANAGAEFSIALVAPYDPSNADLAAGLAYQFDCGDGAGLSEPSTTTSQTCAGGASGTRTVYARISDKDYDGMTFESEVEIVDACVAPGGVSLGAPADPVQLGAAVDVTVAFTAAHDAGTTVQLTWSDGVTASASPAGGMTTFNRTFSAAGVYSAVATVSNGCGSATAGMSTYVVVYDPGAGFVTGGGWIIAAPGSYTADASLGGKTTFGFVAKYQKGANVPTGNTEFQFHANGLDFKSGAYQWLVIAGSRAQYKGEGTIKGRSGTFTFMLTAIDGGPGGANDAFRMKILDAGGGVVFDNRKGSSDASNDATALAGGSISIKKQ